MSQKEVGNRMMKRVVLLVWLFSLIVGLVGGSISCRPIRQFISPEEPYYEETLTIPALSEKQFAIFVNEGMVVEGYVQVTSVCEFGRIYFYIEHSNGSVVYEAPRSFKKRQDFTFKAMDDGICWFHFQNYLCLTSAKVVLKYQ